MIKIRCLSAIAAVGVLLVPVALAQDPKPAPAHLKPGRSASVHVPQQTHAGFALIGTGANIALVMVAATTGNGGGNQNNSQIAPVTTAP